MNKPRDTSNTGLAERTGDASREGIMHQVMPHLRGLMGKRKIKGGPPMGTKDSISAIPGPSVLIGSDID